VFIRVNQCLKNEIGPFVPSCPHKGPWGLSGYESIMQRPKGVLSEVEGNKPNFKMGNINISTARTKAYPKEQRTMNNDRLLKTNSTSPERSRRNKPNSPAPLLRRERIQNLGAKRISRFIGPASKIENPVSRIKHLPHLTTESWRYCAKQTQFPQSQNQRNPLCRKRLRK